jgi:hypothetical protein
VPWGKVWKDPLKFIDEKYFPDEIQADDFRALKKEPSLMSKDALLACLNYWYTLQESNTLPFWFDYIPVGDIERRPSHTRSMLEEQEPDASTTRRPTAKARKAAKMTRKVVRTRKVINKGKGKATTEEHGSDEDEEGEVAGSDTDEDNVVRTPAPKARRASATTRKVLKGRGKAYPEANASDEAGSDDGSAVRTPAPKARKASTTGKVLKKATPKPTKEIRRHSEDEVSVSDDAPVCFITLVMRSLTDS